ncbi:hypothetical protein E3N88_15656 [Mikania micrantha]|uniref:Uncharacterized protein n=1 Tax=Mikania micrantha TaxID=192012 RepID=A0A5N6NYT0_9ASTR|nr:hypothetical protein E3N88_15656 [Mikania micrantha]
MNFNNFFFSIIIFFFDISSNLMQPNTLVIHASNYMFDPDLRSCSTKKKREDINPFKKRKIESTNLVFEMPFLQGNWDVSFVDVFFNGDGGGTVMDL